MSLCQASVPSLIEMSTHPEPASYEARARSFGAIAEHYNRYRPAPPAEAVDWVLPQGCDAVLELGAGTGALTRQLIQRVRQVVSVEPDPAMGAVLSAQLPEVPVVEAVAEALPIVDTRFDAVVAASSWHWMDPELTPIEVARVLRRGGTLGLLWNGADRSIDWVQEIFGPGQSSLSTGLEAAVSGHAVSRFGIRFLRVDHPLVLRRDDGSDGQLQPRDHASRGDAIKGARPIRGAGAGAPRGDRGVDGCASNALRLLARLQRLKRPLS
jgi:SAM-dependent methyltransferase